jgi:hypothetical protein
MGTILSGDQMRGALAKITEIERQLLQKGGYPHDPAKLEEHLQAAIEGRFERPSRRWWKSEDGLIHFLVTSDGTSGKELVERLEEKGHGVSKYAKSVLFSPDFRSTKGITSNVCVVPGSFFASDPTTREVRQELDRRGLTHGKVINAELACLIREKFSNKDLAEMGLWWIVAMHEPIKDSDEDPCFLGADRQGGGLLDTYYDGPGGGWSRYGGFAGVVSQAAA